MMATRGSLHSPMIHAMQRLELLSIITLALAGGWTENIRPLEKPAGFTMFMHLRWKFAPNHTFISR